MRYLALLIIFYVTNEVSSQKIVDGSMDFLLGARTFLMEWDFSHTTYGGTNDVCSILSDKVSVDQWENEIVPSFKKEFDTNFISKFKDNSSIQSTTVYSVNVSVNTIDSNGSISLTITFRDNNNNYVKISYTKGGEIIGGFKSKIINSFEDAGDDLGEFVAVRCKPETDAKCIMIKKNYDEKISPYVTIDGLTFKYVQVISSKFVQDKDSIFDIVEEILSRAYVNSIVVTRLANKEKGVYVGKGSFVRNNSPYKCPHTITVNVKDGKIRISLEICEIETGNLGDSSEKLYFTQQFPFIPQGKSKANLQSYVSNVQFVFDGIQSIIDQFDEGLNRRIDDDW